MNGKGVILGGEEVVLSIGTIFSAGKESFQAVTVGQVADLAPFGQISDLSYEPYIQ